MSTPLNTHVKLNKLKEFFENTSLFGDELRRLCKKRDISQETLAYQLNFDSTAISHWMRGNRLPAPECVVRAGIILKLSESEAHALFFTYFHTCNFHRYAAMLNEAASLNQDDMTKIIFELIIAELKNYSELLQSIIS